MYSKWSVGDTQKQMDVINNKFFKALKNKDENAIYELTQESLRLAEEQKKLKATKEDCKLIDWFWRKYAKKFGVKYETNYTSLNE